MLTRVQTAGATGSGTSPAATFGAQPGNGHLLVAGVFSGSGATITALSAGWLPLTPAQDSADSIRLFYKQAGASESTSASFSTGVGSWTCRLVEYDPAGSFRLLSENAQLTPAAGMFFAPGPSFTPTIVVPAGVPAAVVCFVGDASAFGIATPNVNGSATGVNTVGTDTAFGSGSLMFELLPASTGTSYQGSATPTLIPTQGAAAIAVFGPAGPMYTDARSGKIVLSGSAVESGTGVKSYHDSGSGRIILSGSSSGEAAVHTAARHGTIVLSGTAVEAEVKRRVLLIRERPPLRLNIQVKTPAGRRQRWGLDEPDPANTYSGLTFSTTMPGGFESLGLTLTRRPDREYPDLEELATITAYDAGGDIASQGRIETLPVTSGDQIAITPGAVGWQSHLDDDKAARMVYVERDLTKWQGPSAQRQDEWLLNPPGTVFTSGPSVTPDYTTGFPALDEQLSDSWTESQVVEAWYDANGLVLSQLYGAWKQNGMIDESDPRWGWGGYLLDDDTGVVYDKAGNFEFSPGSLLLNASTASRKWALVQLFNNDGPGGKDGVNYILQWTCLALYGNHGLPKQGPADQTHAPGLLASDVLAHALSTWCPKLAFTTGPAGTIQPSSFVIPQLVFTNPVAPSDIVKAVTQYELQDWAVWEGPTFWWYPRNTFGRKWRARIGPAKLQETGPQINRLWNSVVVQYTDVTGANRTVGPPGSGTNVEDSSLLDPDPLNPANQARITRRALLQMGTTTPAGAIAVGRVFLAEQKLLNSSGQAILVGHVLDDHGVLWPAWKVRAGDQLSFVDGSDPSYRRIVSTNYDDPTRTNQVTLDSPPDGLQALLERLSAVIQPLGFS